MTQRINDPLIQFMLTADMEQVLRIHTEDDVIEVAFNDPERLEDLGRAFNHRATMLRTADQFDFDFDETLAHFDRVESDHYDDEITDETVDLLINDIFGDPHAE